MADEIQDNITTNNQDMMNFKLYLSGVEVVLQMEDRMKLNSGKTKMLVVHNSRLLKDIKHS